jgi:uncharacterized membrane protein
MDAYLLDWLNLLLRWAHVVVAIAWIGSSFYFVFLDSSLREPEDQALRARGVGGELWSVHGGGFYNAHKYPVSPGRIPEHLHWFYWESYSTWLTGFALFVLLYLFQARSFLIDPTVHAWSPPGAIATALALLAGFWFAYDLACRALGERPGGERLVGAAVVALVVFSSWLACHWFAGRAAFLLVGAMMATAMSANVFFWIIPGQRKVIAQLRAGEPVDPAHGRRGRQRSVHNTYFTLPVVVSMLSNHYAFLYNAPDNWLVLVALMAAGALIRHFFVARHRALVLGTRLPFGYLLSGAAVLAGTMAAIAPLQPAGTPSQEPPDFAKVRQVVSERCVMCHNAQLANKGVELHTPPLVERHAQAIYQQAVLQKTMPLNNATRMTEDERALLARWFEAGAPTK